ncbi:MAG: trypsin-like peptidase domain-containing protein [Candidatus Omnitrophica bacterium]|nr:trypsin-like peptidase domain-containing protein [Candidatus Omnitrophota bacterium]
MRLKHYKFFLIVFLWLLLPGSVQAEMSSARETPVVKVVRDNAEAVVNISTEHIILLRENPYWGQYGSEFDYFFDQFFGIQRPRRALKLNSVGSGVIVDAQGVIVTNAHVVHMASNIFIVLNDGTSVPGKVVYENLKDDLAIVRIQPPKPLKQVKLGTTGDIMIGESVVAIGNPLGLENTVTLGVISGKDREINSPQGTTVMGELLQIDAPINPGNSGGALINLDGELVGINVAVVQNSQSIGFAIPVEKVKAALKSHEDNKNLAVKYRKAAGEPRQALSQNKPEPAQPVDRWDPFEEMARMSDEMDRMFQGAFGRGGSPGKGMFNSNIFYDSDFDIEDKGNEYVVKVEVKGVDKDKINIEINQGSLTVSGEHSAVEEEKGPDGYYSSQSIGSFLRTIPLPDDADTEKVKTEFEGDLIVITIPKK